jgi:tRNA nucleotidyltransferase (CCA-adding enzyme)
MPSTSPLPYRWFYVRRRFNQLLANLTITDTQRKDGQISQARIRDCLNRRYWGYGSETTNSMLIGSWGKDTRNRPPRDIDVLFLLPSYRQRFTARLGGWNRDGTEAARYSLGDRTVLSSGAENSTEAV